MASFSIKALTTEIETLLSKKNTGYTEYQEKKRRDNELLTIKRNIGWVLHGAPGQGKGRGASPLPLRCAPSLLVLAETR